MFTLRRHSWPLLICLSINGLALNISQTGQATLNRQQSQAATTHQAALSRKDRSQLYFTTGIQKAINGDYRNAIQDYDQALKLAPSNSEVYYNRGVAYFSIGLAKSAIQDFNQAIALQPTMAEAYGNRGMIRLNLGDHQGALADYKKAKKLFQKQGDFSAAQQMQIWINQQNGTTRL